VSREAEVADGMLSAWRNADNEELAATFKKHNATTFLDNSVARLVRKLKFDETKVVRQENNDNAMFVDDDNESEDDDLDLT
jgi:hypothetical protein